MNTTLEQNINDLTTWIKTTAQATQGFVTEQTPLYIKEYLNWYFWEAIFYTSVTSVLLCITLSVALWSFKKYSKLRPEEIKKGEIYGGDSENYQIATVVFLIVSVFFLSLTCVTAHKALKVKIAPRVVLVESITKKIGN